MKSRVGMGTAIEFWPPEVRQLNIVLPGSTALHEACVALGRDAGNSRMTHSILLWGWAGTGKTLFPRSLHQALNFHGLRYSLLNVHCRKLAELSRDETIEVLPQVESLSRETPLLLLALDHAELLGAGAGVLEDFFTWLSAFLAKPIGNTGTVALVITSRPERIGFRLANLLAWSAYYDLPNRQAAAELLEVHAVPQAYAVADELYRRADGLGVKFTERGLLNAVAYWKTVKESPQHTAREIAETLATACAPVPYDDVEKYLVQNNLWLRKSRDFLELWHSRYARSREL